MSQKGQTSGRTAARSACCLGRGADRRFPWDVYRFQDSIRHFAVLPSPAADAESFERQSLRFVMAETAGNSNRTAAAANNIAAIGHRKKIIQLPFDMTSDWRKLNSNMGAITRPSTSGAGSKSNLRKT